MRDEPSERKEKLMETFVVVDTNYKGTDATQLIMSGEFADYREAFDYAATEFMWFWDKVGYKVVVTESAYAEIERRKAEATN